ncbi:MAG: molybdenum cofactor biosynthesis protein B [Alphaproteobacteria bacterium]|jgi:molybdopterin adenylyltransferase|nr:molybdenum cofactor biosynthesis protein B [Alphaproteobacteria bacterium]MBT4964930.1 molybdenum cofactor biosynthesis protein B [Alphaproteobacteria bacterium]MBT5159830.1 molybdenum cofactor biosynthesis protein B [Alphaproteobacteria bacterium]MBT5917524.1 molybdenum cofactor biosynthesis protein B [Alphaproteobacteria bacterium]MBT6384626.1 molybdenum cofactor biosynthesis protein B [Alphaproteobacteria bacterium]
MSKIGNAPRDFVPVNIAVMTVSDSRTLEDDKSGQILVDRLIAAGHNLADRAIVTDDIDRIVDKLNGWIADAAINVVISTGGTGVTGRDVTPEAFESIYDKFIPGFGEMFRFLSYEKIGVSTIQSRATAGVTNGTYLFAVPGSPGACKDAWDGILQSQLDYRHKPCNFVELMDRLLEGQAGRS